MSLELRIPNIGESITEVEIGQWLKKEGDPVAADDPLVELESDKATVELPSPAAGVLAKQLKRPGDKAKVGEVIGLLEEKGATEPQPAAAPRAAAPSKPQSPQRAESPPLAVSPEKSADKAPPVAKPPAKPSKAPPPSAASPVESPVESPPTEPKPPAATREPKPAPPPPATAQPPPRVPIPVGERQEEVVPMSPIRRRIAQRLVEAHQAAALLTTFNELDMSAVNELRRDYKETFQTKYGVKLGLMSFFVKAAVDALKQIPQLNAEVRGTDIVYRNYYDIGIAISGGKGLVVPVLRDAERMSFAEVERAIADLAERARINRLGLGELAGGTFTITNGGVFGSLLSTPLVNPPQSGVLGMHAIQDRPVARDGAVVIRPMMYVALTYDHRVVDGREAVAFLGRIKEVIENPSLMLIEV